MIQHRSPISGVDAYRDRYVATAGYDNQLILWDAVEKVAVARASHDHLANQCRFSLSGRHLVSAGSDHTARLWEVPSLKLVAVFADHDDDVEMASICPEAPLVATASRDDCVRIFDFSGQRRAKLVGHASDVISVEWCRGGRELVSSSDDGTVRRWCAETGRLLDTVDLGGVETDSVVCADDGVLFAGTDAGEIVAIVDVGADGRGSLVRTRAHDAGIKRLVYDAATRRLLSASYDRTIRLWSVAGRPGRGELRLELSSEAPAAVWLRSCAFAGRGRLVFGTFGSAYAVFDCASGGWDLSGVDETPGVNAVCAWDGAIYAVGDAGRVTRGGAVATELGSLCNFLLPWRGRLLTGGHLGVVFDALTGEPLYRHRAPLNCGAVLRRGGEELCVLGAYTGEAIVLRARGGAVELVEVVPLHDNAIKGLACNERQLFSVCATGAAALHDIGSFACAQAIPDAHAQISNGAACLPDGRFASVSRDRALRLWRGAESTAIATPHTHSIKCVAVCPDTGVIATGSYTGTVALYDVRAGAWTSVERPTAHGISSLAPAGAPGAFLASSYDGEVYTVPRRRTTSASRLAFE